MTIYINTNLNSLNAQRHLTSSGKVLDNATERLSSGLRINRASDDAAGLAISNRLTTQVRGLSQAIRNANDGISLIQTAEGALSESSNILQRMRELSVQSANGIYSETDRATLNSEVQQLIAELDRIATTTSFNGRSVLDGTLGQLDLQVGANTQQTIGMKIDSIETSKLGLGSTSGDLMGSAMTLSGTGALANAIADGDVLINGQSFGKLDAGTSLDTLVSAINDEVNGITASLYLELEASSVGDGVLGEDDVLTLTILKADATTITAEISGTNSLEELAAAITDNSSGLLKGSLDDEGKLLVTGTNVANVSISDPTGSATGLSGSSSSGGSIYQTLIDNLNNTWLKESESLILQEFGIQAPGGTEIDLVFAETDGSFTGDTTGVSAATLAGVQSDGAGNTVAAVYNDPSNLKLFVDMADFASEEGSSPLFHDRVIAHEMVHAIMAADIPVANNTTLPGWFTEGIAEFIHGADERVTNDINNSGIAAISGAGSLKRDAGSPNDSEGYSAGYLAVRILHEELQAIGSNGIEDILAAMQNPATDLDDAIAAQGINWGTGTGLTAFEDWFEGGAAFAYVDDDVNGNFNYGGFSPNFLPVSNLELGDTDTGSIAGSDYGGGTLTASSVISGNITGTPSFTFNLPSGFSAGAAGASARLVFESEHGDPVTVTRGNTGRLADLSFLGFQDMSKEGVIRGVGITDPTSAWPAGEIKINGATVDVTDTGSFEGKLDAINKLSEDTGVSASAFASATIYMDSFDFTDWSTTNYGDFGINGIAIIGIGDDTSTEEMITTINGFTEETGVSARLNGTSIILEANRSITIHDTDAATGPDAANFFGASNAGNARILSSANDASNASAVAITDNTKIEAGIELRSASGNPIQLELGSASSNTTGWLETNATNESGSSGGFGTAMQSVNVATQASAQKAIGVIDNALETINDTRSQLGAVNNRLDFTISSLANIMENSTSARSRILDADFAKETARLSAAQVMQQASSAMLAQANALPQTVLSLLQ